MTRVIAITSGKGGVGKSLAYDEYVSLADGNAIEIGPYIDKLILENPLAVKKMLVQTTNRKTETFEVLEPEAGLELDIFEFNSTAQTMSHNKKLPICLMRKPAPAELVKISCPSGNITVTPEHKFIVMKNGTFLKRSAEQLTAEDYVLTFKTSCDIKNSENSVPKEIAQWLGLVIGDGHMEGYNAHVYSEPGEFAEIIRASFQRIFGNNIADLR